MALPRPPEHIGRLFWGSLVVLPCAAFLVGSPVAGAAMVAACCLANVALWRVNDRERALTASALRRMELQYAVTDALASAASLDDAVPKLLRLIGRRLEFTTGLLWTPDADGEHLRPGAPGLPTRPSSRTCAGFATPSPTGAGKGWRGAPLERLTRQLALFMTASPACRRPPRTRTPRCATP